MAGGLDVTEQVSGGPDFNDFWLPNFLALEDVEGRPLFIRPDAINAIFFRGDTVIVQTNEEAHALSRDGGTRLLSWAQSRSIVPGLHNLVADRRPGDDLTG